MNILVTGSNGQLGSSIRKLTGNSDDKYYFTSFTPNPDNGIEKLDITDSDSVDEYIKTHNIDIVINCAAYTNTEKAQIEPKLARLTNVDAVSYLCGAIKRRNGLIVHISTDYVFSGGDYNLPLVEEDEENPDGVYATTKLDGEDAVALSGAKWVTLRTSWVYSEYGGNFCKTILGKLKDGSHMQVVYDQVGTPTYAGDLAAGILKVIEEYKDGGVEKNRWEKEGLYHFSNEGVCSWYDFAQMIRLLSGHENDSVIEPSFTDIENCTFLRPSYSVLSKSKFKKNFSHDIPYWVDSLKICLKNLNTLQ